MAKQYRPVNRDQVFLLPESMTDWLDEDHLVWFVIAAVERVDTSAFHGKARLGGAGRAGYDPDMLLTLLVYAMAHGQRSSRRIEQLCETDVAFRIICAGDTPDHTVLARFRQRHEQSLESLLTRVLELCAELGMLRLGVVALDGTKVAANASIQANRTGETLRRIAAEHLKNCAAADAEEDALFGADSRGDELPRRPGDRSGWDQRITKAIKVIEEREQSDAERQQAARDYLAVSRARPVAGRTPNGVDKVEAARARWERIRARQQAKYDKWLDVCEAAGKIPWRKIPKVDDHCDVKKYRKLYEKAVREQAARETGSQPEPGDGSNTGMQAKYLANLTDPDSRVLPTRNGFIQGYNCQLLTSENLFILYALATQHPNDAPQLVPAMTATRNLAAGLAAHLQARQARHGDLASMQAALVIGLLLADAGYHSEANLNAAGPDRLIANSARRNLPKDGTDPTPPPGESATMIEKNAHRLATDEGRHAYRKRAPIAETPNAWIKHRRDLKTGFCRRGLKAAQSELSFAAAVTNLLRLRTLGITTTQLAPA